MSNYKQTKMRQEHQQMIAEDLNRAIGYIKECSVQGKVTNEGFETFESAMSAIQMAMHHAVEFTPEGKLWEAARNYWQADMNHDRAEREVEKLMASLMVKDAKCIVTE